MLAQLGSCFLHTLAVAVSYAVPMRPLFLQSAMAATRSNGSIQDHDPTQDSDEEEAHTEFTPLLASGRGLSTASDNLIFGYSSVTRVTGSPATKPQETKACTSGKRVAEEKGRRKGRKKGEEIKGSVKVKQPYQAAATQWHVLIQPACSLAPAFPQPGFQSWPFSGLILCSTLGIWLVQPCTETEDDSQRD